MKRQRNILGKQKKIVGEAENQHLREMKNNIKYRKNLKNVAIKKQDKEVLGVKKYSQRTKNKTSLKTADRRQLRAKKDSYKAREASKRYSIQRLEKSS